MDSKGQKMALLVGCNYTNTPHELHGCHNDVFDMCETLVTRFGFDRKSIEVITDKDDSVVMPTGANIRKALDKLISRAKEGDVLFFHYSGHGTLVKSHHREEEAIVPCDFNLITSVDMRQLVNRVPKGATFTILSDSCHSGGLIDAETEQIGPTTPNKNIVPTFHRTKAIPLQSILEHFKSPMDNIGSHLVTTFGAEASLMFRLPPMVDPVIEWPQKIDEGILLSGCQKNETCADVGNIGNGEKPCGAFSHAIQMVLKENTKALSNREIVMMARKVLKDQNFINQHPCLYCSDQNADAMFLE